MLDLLHSRLYARPQDVEVLKAEPDYVKDRYYTIIKTTIDAPFRWTRQQAADDLRISKRHLYRILGNYRDTNSKIPATGCLRKSCSKPTISSTTTADFIGEPKEFLAKSIPENGTGTGFPK